MQIAGLKRRYTRCMVYTSFACGLVLGGCALPVMLAPTLLDSDVQTRLTALAACVSRSQQMVTSALDAGVSAGPLAPANSRIADAQDMLETAQHLLQQQHLPEADARAVQGLTACESVAQMVAKACQHAAERKAQTRRSSEAERRVVQIVACLDGTRSIVEQAQTAAVETAEAQSARSAFESAAAALAHARVALAAHDPETAWEYLDMAAADCQLAQAAGAQATVAAPLSRVPARRSP